MLRRRVMPFLLALSLLHIAQTVRMSPPFLHMLRITKALLRNVDTINERK